MYDRFKANLKKPFSFFLLSFFSYFFYCTDSYHLSQTIALRPGVPHFRWRSLFALVPCLCVGLCALVELFVVKVQRSCIDLNVCLACCGLPLVFLASGLPNWRRNPLAADCCLMSGLPNWRRNPLAADIPGHAILSDPRRNYSVHPRVLRGYSSSFPIYFAMRPPVNIFAFSSFR